jgi:hypothetical protein
MVAKCFLPALILMAGGCATPQAPRAARSFPQEALITQRAVLTARGQQFTLNGYLALSESRGKRLIVTENFGNVMADVLMKPDGSIHIMRSSPAFRPAWIRRYVAADLECVFGDPAKRKCRVTELSSKHFLIKRWLYSLDLQILDVKPGPQPPQMFDETAKATP